MSATPTPRAVCPYCYRPMDYATGMAPGQIPKPGNWTLCIECLEISRFTEGLALRAIDEMEKLQVTGGEYGAAFDTLRQTIREARARFQAKRDGGR